MEMSDKSEKNQEPQKHISDISQLPLRLPIQEVYNITGIGAVSVGRVETGVLKVGDKVSLEPAGVSGAVILVKGMNDEPMQQAEPGDEIGFSISGVKKSKLRRGDVCGPASKPPTVAKEFTAQIEVLNHPSAICVGYTPVFHTHTAQVACRFVETISKLDQRTGKVLEKNPTFLKTGDTGVVRIAPTRSLVLEPYEEIPQLGIFAIRDMGATVATGKVLNVTPVIRSSGASTGSVVNKIIKFIKR